MNPAPRRTSFNESEAARLVLAVNRARKADGLTAADALAYVQAMHWSAPPAVWARVAELLEAAK